MQPTRPALVLFTVAAAACASEPFDDGAPEVLSLVRTETLTARYRTWERGRTGASAHLAVRLQPTRGLTEAPSDASGTVTLDSGGSRVTVELVGLGREPAVQVWLCDNRAGAGASTLPDAHDGWIDAGRFEVAEGRARGTVRLAADALAGFELDRVVIARPGPTPLGRLLLFGGPGVFERLQRRLARGSSDEVEQELAELVRRGAELFERETFVGNGRTCTTCHPAANNLTLDPSFIATLAPEDPLFVAERVPALAELEHPSLLRQRALILENLDGFERPGVLRAVPHTFALTTSITGPAVPFDNTLNPPLGITPPADRTGWGGDGAPGSGSLRDFALGAVVQHFPRTLARVPDRDFRVPTDEELDALEAFQLALGRDEDLDLAGLRFRNPVVARGQELFLRTDTAGGTLPAGKCTLCHSNGGANIDGPFFSALLGVEVAGNANFGTGVNNLAAAPGEILDPDLPRDGGFARVPHDGTLCTPPTGGFGTVTPEGGVLPPGLCEEDFNTPPLVESADTPPFFHDNALDSLEAAVGFYDGAAFNGSAGGQFLATIDSGGIGIRLDASEIGALAHLLRVLNVLENLRSSSDMAERARAGSTKTARRLLRQVAREVGQAQAMLGGVHLHPEAAAELGRARERAEKLLVIRGAIDRTRIDALLASLARARDELVLPDE